MTTSRLRRALLALTFLCLTGCTVPVAVDLDEASANRIIEVLERAGVAADKVVDRRGEGRWSIEVARDDASAAVAAMAREHVPRPDSSDLLDRLDDGAVIPSRSSEQARLLAATAAQLEQSLIALDSILTARVHLAVPPDDPLRPSRERPAPSASVLVSYRDAKTAMSEAQIQRLVAGAVAGLEEGQVTVVATTVPTPPPRADRELARFGPITTTRASVGRLRAVAIALTLLDLLLAGIIVAMWSKVRRLRHQRPASPAAQVSR